MILDRLRAETRADHDHIEAVVGLLAPDLTRDRYVHFLERMLGYLEPLEAALSAASGWAQLGVDPRTRARAHLLASDLTSLGHGPEQLARLPRCEALPDVSSPSRALGCLYVLEGARLGGRVLTRALGPHLGVDPANGLAFLGGGPVHAAESWRMLCERLEHWASAHPECEDDVVRAARETFSTMAEWHSVQTPRGGPR